MLPDTYVLLEVQPEDAESVDVIGWLISEHEGSLVVGSFRREDDGHYPTHFVPKGFIKSRMDFSLDAARAK